MQQQRLQRVRCRGVLQLRHQRQRQCQRQCQHKHQPRRARAAMGSQASRRGSGKRRSGSGKAQLLQNGERRAAERALSRRRRPVLSLPPLAVAGSAGCLLIWLGEISSRGRRAVPLSHWPKTSCHISPGAGGFQIWQVRSKTTWEVLSQGRAPGNLVLNLTSPIARELERFEIRIHKKLYLRI